MHHGILLHLASLRTLKKLELLLVLPRATLALVLWQPQAFEGRLLIRCDLPVEHTELCHRQCPTAICLTY